VLVPSPVTVGRMPSMEVLSVDETMGPGESTLFKASRRPLAAPVLPFEPVEDADRLRGRPSASTSVMPAPLLLPASGFHGLATFVFIDKSVRAKTRLRVERQMEQSTY